MLRILLVEDDPDVAMVVAALLEAAGHHVTMAGDGRQGYDIAMQEQPELIVTDLMMPVMSGLEMAAALRASGFTRPIVLCSAVAENHVGAGPDGYNVFLLKPYRSEELLEAIQRLHAADGTPR